MAIKQILLLMPLAERFDPIKAIEKRRWINGESDTDPVFHSQNTPCIGETKVCKIKEMLVSI